MTDQQIQHIGLTCAYTPLPVIAAAGFAPFRILPMGDMPDKAGHLLHDNLCPHVKRVLDRALDEKLPELAGMVFINSCDAMRRLADAWQNVRPADQVIILDLPATGDETAILFYADELRRLAQALAKWSGRAVAEDDLRAAIIDYNKLAEALEDLHRRIGKGEIAGGRAKMQELYNFAATHPLKETLANLNTVAAENPPVDAVDDGVPVYLFGNVMPDPEAFRLIESCGTRIVGDDFCTGSRMFAKMTPSKTGSVFEQVARSLLTQPPCARSFTPQQPGRIATDVLKQAKSCGARGVICHTLKFCDPYLARMPMVREAMREANLPLLLLEGDCTLRSMGQQRTRIEAFIEMLR
jgi:benzoyl-CoA reductase/2-hydroxyglutaryl-CoA dehydratase subunit BcrC/BadD/HgdB